MRGVLTNEQIQFVGTVFLLVGIVGTGVTVGVLYRMNNSISAWIALLLFALATLWAAWLIPW